MARNAKDRSYCCSRLWLFGAIMKKQPSKSGQTNEAFYLGSLARPDPGCTGISELKSWDIYCKNWGDLPFHFGHRMAQADT